LLCDLFGLLEEYSELVGYCKTRSELIRLSAQDRYLAAPLVGFPFQEDDTQLAYNAGSITYFEIKCQVETSSLAQLFINYGNSPNVSEAVPRLFASGEPMDKDSIKFMLSSNNVWGQKTERAQLLGQYHETMSTEYHVAGEFDQVAQPQGGKCTFPINMRGPVTWVAVICQDQRNLANKNNCSGSTVEGGEFLKQFNIITASTPREDGLPAIMQSVAKPMELFGCTPLTKIYVQNYTTSHKKISTFQNMTNAERLQFSGIMNSHGGCRVTVIYGSYNGTWSERGNGGPIWQ